MKLIYYGAGFMARQAAPPEGRLAAPDLKKARAWAQAMIRGETRPFGSPRKQPRGTGAPYKTPVPRWKKAQPSAAFFFLALGRVSGRSTSSRMDMGAPSPSLSPRGIIRV